MVLAGRPNSQRNLFGTAKEMWPVMTSGCVSVFRERVCVKSADQVWKLVCEANQPLSTALVSAARATKLQVPSSKQQRITKRQTLSPFRCTSTLLEIEIWSFIGAWVLLVGAFPSTATPVQNDTTV